MADKTILLLVVLFIGIGIFSFNDYATKKEGIGPIGRLLDYVGFYKEEKEEYLRVEHNKSHFVQYADANLKRLSKKYAAIEQQRTRLIEHRSIILNQLSGMNDEVIKEAERINGILNTEKKAFLEKFPQVAEIGKLLVKTHQEQDQDLKQDGYNLITEKIESLRDSIKVYPENRKQVDQIFVGLMTEIASFNAQTNYCLSDQECIEDEVSLMTNNLSDIFKQVEDVSAADLTEVRKIIDELTLGVQEEVKYLNEKEKEFKENDDYTESRFQELVQQLVEVTYTDLQDLISLYKELELEQSILMEGIAEHNYEFFTQQSKSYEVLKELVEKLASNQITDFSSVKDIYISSELRFEVLFEDLIENQKEIFEVLSEASFEGQYFIEEVGQLLDIDVLRLINDKEYASSKKSEFQQQWLRMQDYRKMFEPKKYSSQATRMDNHVRQIDLNIKPIQQGSIDLGIKNLSQPILRDQRIRNSNAREQMKRLRQKARENSKR